MMRPIRSDRLPSALLTIATLAIGLAIGARAEAAETNISNQPIASTNAASVKPNVMLLMDASGSMGYTHMPDDVELVMGPNSVGYKSSQCNVLYYDPGKAYVLPRRFDGAPFAASNFNDALNAGFGEFYTVLDDSKTPLATAFRAYASLVTAPQVPTLRNAIGNDPAQQAYYYRHSGTPTLQDCQTVDPTASVNTSGTLPSAGSGLWTRVLVPGTTEEQNFANWYTYYRTRISLLKSAASLAFTPLTDTYRVGFITVSPKANPHSDQDIQESKFLKVNDFTPGHRFNWFNKLFSQVPGGSSPAREGLARVGRYYGGQDDGINKGMPAKNDASGQNDPLQYSCQRNFTIMTTDGYWNAQAETDYLGTLDGGPVKLNGKDKVNQQDGSYIAPGDDCPLSNPYCPRPIFDGNTSGERTVRDAWVLYDSEPCSLPTSLETIYRTIQTRSRWNATYQRTTRREQYREVTRTRDLATYTNTLLDKKKIKQTTEQYVRTTTTESRTAYQILKSQYQSSRTTTQQTADSSQSQANTYQIEQRDTRQLQTSTQHVQQRRQTSRVTVQHQLERRQFTYQRVQTRKHVFRYATKPKSEEVFLPAMECGPPATHDCQTFTDFGPAFVDPDPACLDSDSTTFPFWKTRCTAGPATVALAPVASCTAGTTNTGSPNWIKTICSDNQVQVPTFVASCTPGIDGSQIRSICTNPPGPNNTTVVGVDPMTCTASAGSDPDFIQVSCPFTLDETTYPDAACTNGTESGFIVRTCTSPTATNYTGYVATCSPTTLANNQRITCGSVETVAGPEFVPACSGGVVAGPALRTCTTLPITTEYVPTPCVPGTGPGPSFIIRSCSLSLGTNFDDQPVPQSPACVSQTASVGNGYRTIACNPPEIVTAYVAPGTCTPDDGNTGPNFIKVECNGPVETMPPTVVDPTTCIADPTGSAPDYITTTCQSNPQTPWATCVNFNSGPPNWIQYVCGSTDLVEAVSFCTVGTTYPTAGVTVTCSKPAGPNNVTNEPTTSCTEQLPNAGNSYVRRTCSTQITLAQGPAASCTPFVDAANELEITSCVFDNPQGSAYVDTCTATTSPISPYIRTTCSQPPGPGYNDGAVTRVETCTLGTTYDGSSIATTCTLVDTGAQPEPGGAAACSADQVAAVGNNWTAIDCETFASQSPQTVPTCAAVPPSAPLYEYKTCTALPPSVGPTPSAPCTDFVDGNEQVTCTRTLFSGPPNPTCTGVVGGGPNFNEVCTTAGTGVGERERATRTVTTTVSSTSGGALVTTLSTSSVVDAPVYGACVASVTPPSPNPQQAPPDGSCAAWPCTTDVATPGNQGSKNSLADVANYYYKTDLRDDDNAWPDNVSGPQSPNPEVDSAKHQHMTTFVLGLGVSGSLAFHPDYWKTTNTLGDFPGIRSGAVNWPIWPDPTITYTQTSDYEDPKSIDDFWHTAVNGRGLFFNASDTASVVAGLNSVLTSALENPLSGAGDAASSFAPIVGQDDYVYRSSYVPKGWKGDLEAFNQNDTTGGLGSLVWSADALLAPRVKAACDDRNIYVMRNGVSLVPFTWKTRTCVGGIPAGPELNDLDDTEKPHFETPVLPLNQYTPMAPYPSQLAAARGANLVNFIRGQKGFEEFIPGNDNRLFRRRTSVLGDFVNSQPVFVGKPFARYVESGYSQFVADNLGRRKMLYIGGNDGMLHAFDALTGNERWAVIPQTVLPRLYKLADTNYDYEHEYYVDGTPVVGDVKIGTVPTWKTILVVGLNKGGKGYMALDITNPELAPLPLWEFRVGAPCDTTVDNFNSTLKSDCNLGLTFGKPVITKLEGRWVVLVTSGYNNVGAAANDGEGFVYAIDAELGTVVKKVSTNVGSTVTPSGLAQINNFVDDAFVDNTTLRAYGGDLLGNIWRFEFTPPAVKLIGTAKDPVGNDPQPITVRPELAEKDGKPMVFVGTGKLLGTPDIDDDQVQSVYGIVDPLTPASPAPVYDPLRNALVPLTMVQTGHKATAKRTISCAGSTAECDRTGGWVLDLRSTPPVMVNGDVADKGERVNINMQVVFGTLVFASNVPTPDPCNAGGHSYFNYVDWRTGLRAFDAPLIDAGQPTLGYNTVTFIGDALASGFNIYKLGGKLYPVSRNSDTSGTTGGPISAAGESKGKRISWREIVTQ